MCLWSNPHVCSNYRLSHKQVVILRITVLWFLAFLLEHLSLFLARAHHSTRPSLVTPRGRSVCVGVQESGRWNGSRGGSDHTGGGGEWQTIPAVKFPYISLSVFIDLSFYSPQSVAHTSRLLWSHAPLSLTLQTNCTDCPFPPPPIISLNICRLVFFDSVQIRCDQKLKAHRKFTKPLNLLITPYYLSSNIGLLC